MATNPKVYDLLNSLAYQSPQYDMAGVNTSSGDDSAPSRPDLHWTPTMAAAQDGRGIPTMPNVDLPIQPFDLQQAMTAPTQLDRGSDLAPAVDPMQAYSDKLLNSPDLGRPSDYAGGTPSGGAAQTMRQRVTAPLRDALTSLLHPMGGAPDPTMAASQGTITPQSPQDLQQFMRDRYQNYAGLTDRNMQTMQDQMRGLNRQDSIDNFLGRVVSPIMGGMMARGGNPYAMQIANKLSSDIDSRTASHRDEAFRLMQAANGYGKQAFDQMVASDPNTIKNQLALLKAMTDAQRGQAYTDQVHGQNQIGMDRNGIMRDSNQIRQSQIDQQAQQAADKLAETKRQFNLQYQNETEKVKQLVMNGQMSRAEATARINHMGDQLRIANDRIEMAGKQLATQIWQTKYNAGQASDRLDRAIGAQNTRAAGEMVYNKDTGKMEPKYSAGFVDKYGLQAPDDGTTDSGSGNPLDGIMAGLNNWFNGPPATAAAPTAKTGTSAQVYTPDQIEQMKAILAERKRKAANGQ